MNGFLTQVIDNDEREGLFWSPIEIEEEIFTITYQNFMKSNMNDFEEWWNSNNPTILIERVFVTEVWV